MKRRRFLQAGLMAAAGASTAHMHASADDLRARAERILRGWDGLPNHRTGSRGDLETARWLIDEMSRVGAQGTLDGFTFSRRIPQACWVEVGTERIVGVPCFDGGLGAGAPIESNLEPLSTGNAIGVVEAGMTLAEPGARALHRARRSANHAAIVAISVPLSSPGLTLINADAYLAPYGPPVLQVTSAARDRLLDAAAQRARARVRVHFEEEEARAFNVGARVLGREPKLAPVVIMTPRSGWWRCTSERGGGIVAFLETLRYFVANPPRRTVVFTANTGHEIGHLGLDAFSERSDGRIADAFAWLHLGANFAARGGRIRLQASNIAWLDDARGHLHAAGIDSDVTPIGTRPLGEARNVFDAGGHYLSILGDNPLFHHPEDRWPDAVDLNQTAIASEVMMTMAARLANS